MNALLMAYSNNNHKIPDACVMRHSFMYMMSLSLTISRQALMSPVYRRGNHSSQRLGDFSTVTQHVLSVPLNEHCICSCLRSWEQGRWGDHGEKNTYLHKRHAISIR